MRRTGARVEQAEVVVDLGYRPDCRPRIVPGGFLLDGNRGRESLDRIDIRFFHEAEELPRVRGERLDVAPLPLGVDRVEREGGFTRSGEAGNDGQAVARDRYIDVPEVVLASAAYDQGFFGHSLVKSRIAPQDSTRPACVITATTNAELPVLGCSCR